MLCLRRSSLLCPPPKIPVTHTHTQVPQKKLLPHLVPPPYFLHPFPPLVVDIPLLPFYCFISKETSLFFSTLMAFLLLPLANCREMGRSPFCFLIGHPSLPLSLTQFLSLHLSLPIFPLLHPIRFWLHSFLGGWGGERLLWRRNAKASSPFFWLHLFALRDLAHQRYGRAA